MKWINKFSYFRPVQKKLSCTHRVVVIYVTVLVRIYVHTNQPDFIAFDLSIAVYQADLSFTAGFNFGSLQNNSGLERLQNGVFVPYFSVIFFSSSAISSWNNKIKSYFYYVLKANNCWLYLCQLIKISRVILSIFSSGYRKAVTL